MPTVKASLTPHGKVLYRQYRDWSANQPLGPFEMSVEDFINNILCGPVSKYNGFCLHCASFKRLHVATFCVECALGAISTR